ncbi:MAG: bifunctional glutamate N-acetyltransferase/amino-acid acetyltransferase ArgJ [Actinomycetota bacterium]|nr:bifunctional glutamate N-acetyltransferase/amino-acid acetyltransferase ArgJ [Actinomycetota bacterium]MDA3019522.1 bifunctional glutamate N-acetyltransferase/amino-acid acetyltransferase ArgJ [Actinomycetota bacterium]
MTALPQGFTSFVTNIGIKDTSEDFTVVAADNVVAAAGVFTQSRFAGPSVFVSCKHIASHSARAVVVISKNANVATGEQGLANAFEVVQGVAAKLGCDPHDVLIASTGVIGRPYPIEKVRTGLASLPFPLPNNDADSVARGIMTTDTVHKIAEATIGAGPARVVGVAKGVGMIEPNMATLITMAFTDAAVEGDALDAIWRRVIDRTFNCVSVDTDTSTSDTAIVLASGAAGAVDLAELEIALEEVTRSLTKQVARDGEGAETLIEVCVDQARDSEQAKTVAKAIVNSPLVKTAVHGADPNWGRVAMAVGKCSQYTDIDQDKVIIRFGDQEVYPVAVNETGLKQLSEYMRGDDVRIHVSLQTGQATSTVWGCDLTDGYVRINADYTT